MSFNLMRFGATPPPLKCSVPNNAQAPQNQAGRHRRHRKMVAKADLEFLRRPSMASALSVRLHRAYLYRYIESDREHDAVRR